MRIFLRGLWRRHLDGLNLVLDLILDLDLDYRV